MVKKVVVIICSFFIWPAFASESPAPEDIEDMNDSELSETIIEANSSMREYLDDIVSTQKDKSPQIIADSVVEGFENDPLLTTEFTTNVLHWGTDKPESFYRLNAHERKSRRLSEASLNMLSKIQQDFIEIAAREAAAKENKTVKKDTDDYKTNSNDALAKAFKSNKKYIDARALRQKAALSATNEYAQLVGNAYKDNPRSTLSLVSALTQAIRQQSQDDRSKTLIRTSLSEIENILKAQPDHARKLQKVSEEEARAKRLMLLLPQSGVNEELLCELGQLSPKSKQEILAAAFSQAKAKNDAKIESARADMRQPQKELMRASLETIKRDTLLEKAKQDQIAKDTSSK